MADIFWTGNQRATRRKYTFSVTTAVVNDAITMTVNSKVEAYTITSTTTSTAAAGAVAAWQASLVPEIAGQFEFSVSGAEITVEGPEDGRPVSAAFAATGTSAISSVTAVTPTSPHDANDTANWSTGAVPGNGDVAVFENTDVSCLYNLDAFDGETVGVVKRASYGGQIGLPDTNPLGFPEYLDTHLETAGTAVTVEDNGVAFRLLSNAASAETVNVTGDGAGTLYSETVEITGLLTASVVNVNGGSLALDPLTSQSSAVGTLRVANAAFRSGPGCVITTGTVINSRAEVGGNWTSLTVDRGAEVRAARAATAATGTTIDGGVVRWASTGGPGAVTVGSDGTLDIGPAPATVTVGTITLEPGATLLDPNDRMAKTYNLVLNGEIEEMTLDLGTRFNLAVS